MKLSLIWLCWFTFGVQGYLCAQEHGTTKNAHLRGHVKRVSGEEYQIGYDGRKLLRSYTDTYNPQGNVVSCLSTCEPYHEVFYDGGSSSMKIDRGNYYCFYNEKDSLIGYVDYSCEGSLRDSVKYAYDAHDRISQVIHYASDGNVQMIDKYDEHGNIISSKNFSELGICVFRFEDEYDEQFKLLKREYHRGDSLSSRDVLKYNFRDSLEEEKWISYIPTEQVFHTINCKYDVDGKKVEQINYWLRGDIGSTSITRYKYDKRGGLVEQICFYGDTLTKCSKIISAYNKSGLLTKSQFYDTLGRLACVVFKDEQNRDTLNITYEYSSGRKTPDKATKRIRFNKDGDEVSTKVFDARRHLTFKETREFKYDKYGNWVLKTESVYGKPYKVTEREIEYH